MLCDCTDSALPCEERADVCSHPLCLRALGKGIRDGLGCVPFSAFCVLLLLWWESPDGSFDSCPGYFYFCVSTIVFSLKEVVLIFRMYFVFRMLVVELELIYCFEPSRFDPEIKALLLSADVSEREFLRNSIWTPFLGIGLIMSKG